MLISPDLCIKNSGKPIHQFKLSFCTKNTSSGVIINVKIYSLFRKNGYFYFDGSPLQEK
jgi:hypothetical protein